MNQVEQLVLRRLAADGTFIAVMYGYFVEGKSPSELADIAGMSRTAVRAKIQRFRGSLHDVQVKHLLTKVLPHVNGISPIILKLNGKHYCLLCERVVPNPITHIRSKHRDILQKLTQHVISKARNGGKP